MLKSKKISMLPLIVTIDRFENDKAVLILPDGQKIQLDRTLLEPGLKPGDCLNLKFTYNDKETAKRNLQARNLLNKIKQSNHENS